MAVPFSYLTSEQAECLSSALRCDILMAFLNLGPCGIKDVAVFIDRRPDSLYHHVRKLLDVALIKQVGTRRVVKRDEAMYEVCAERTLLERTPWDKQYTLAARRFITSTFDAVRVQCEQSVAEHGNESNFTDRMLVRRYSLRLDEEAAKELREKLLELDKWLIERSISRNGKFYSVLVADIPKPSGKKKRLKNEG